MAAFVAEVLDCETIIRSVCMCAQVIFILNICKKKKNWQNKSLEWVEWVDITTCINALISKKIENTTKTYEVQWVQGLRVVQVQFLWG